jgi:ATP-dependent protease HslVU (ClpYQ) peptidase subunit
MTAIVGIAHNGTVHIGGDSAGVAGYVVHPRADTKVFTTGLYAFGFTTSFRMGQLIRWAWTPPEPPAGDLDRFMATTFVDGVRDCLKAGGWASKENERESGGVFLVGVAGRLFFVDSDYQIGESAQGYDAVGSGDELALGALYATARTRLSPRSRLQVALEAAERFNGNVQGPFAYVSTPPAAPAPPRSDG